MEAGKTASPIFANGVAFLVYLLMAIALTALTVFVVPSLARTVGAGFVIQMLAMLGFLRTRKAMLDRDNR